MDLLLLQVSFVNIQSKCIQRCSDLIRPVIVGLGSAHNVSVLVEFPLGVPGLPRRPRLWPHANLQRQDVHLVAMDTVVQHAKAK